MFYYFLLHIPLEYFLYLLLYMLTSVPARTPSIDNMDHTRRVERRERVNYLLIAISCNVYYDDDRELSLESIENIVWSMLSQTIHSTVYAPYLQ